LIGSSFGVARLASPSHQNFPNCLPPADLLSADQKIECSKLILIGDAKSYSGKTVDIGLKSPAYATVEVSIGV
jgi:hypothetical protein